MSTSSKSTQRLPTAILRIDDVSKSFGKVPVLHNIFLDVQHGEKIVLCGPSGSGKSTLLRCVNGLERITSGTVEADGYRFNSSEADPTVLSSKIGMVFQQFNLFAHLTALQNCTLALRWIEGLSKFAAAERAIELLTRVGLNGHFQKYPSQLSGGQQQRVAIARALCRCPKIMLFDEPTSSLDPEMVSEVTDVIRQLAKSGMTMLIVTHEMGFARNLADRIIFMSDGQIVEKSPPADFFERPQSEKAAAFVRKIRAI
jgi:ABC-type polar amino acid transport system ATPase subunit